MAKGEHQVKTANNNLVDAKGSGTISFYVDRPSAKPAKIVLQDVLYVPACGQCSQPSRPSGIGQDGDGSQESVHPRAGWRWRRLFEAGRRQTERTAVDGEVIEHITKIIRKSFQLLF